MHRKLTLEECKKGKGHPLDQMVPTPFGDKRWGDLCTGDYLFGLDGKPTRILEINDCGELPTYIVKFLNGAEIEVDGYHTWLFDDHENNIRLDYTGATFDRSKKRHAVTKDIMLNRDLSGLNWRLPVIKPPEPMNPVYADIDPYILGFLIASDSLGGMPEFDVYKDCTDIVDEVLRSGNAPEHHTLCRNGFYHFSYWEEGRRRIVNYLTRTKLLGKSVEEAFLPEEVFEFRAADRWRLLQGLMDRLGVVYQENCVYTAASAQLCKDITRLVASLGGESRTLLPTKNEGCESWFNVIINIRDNPFLGSSLYITWEKRKKRQTRTLSRKLISVEPTNEKKHIRCVKVDAYDSIYLCDVIHYTPTHNTGEFECSES